MAKYKIPTHRVFKDFALVKTLTGTYICPGWIPVENGTTREDIEWSDDIIIEKPIESTSVKPETQKKLEFRVPSSNGKSEYLVRFRGGVWSCTCPASTFRRGNCKHIKEIEAK